MRSYAHILASQGFSGLKENGVERAGAKQVLGTPLEIVVIGHGRMLSYLAYCVKLCTSRAMATRR